MENTSYLLLQASRSLKQALDTRLKAYDITATQFAVLYQIGQHNQAITSSQVSELLGLDKPTVSEVIKRLINKGKLVKIPNPLDKRSDYLCVNQQVLALIRQLKKESDDLNHAIFNEYNTNQVKAFQAILNHIISFQKKGKPTIKEIFMNITTDLLPLFKKHTLTFIRQYNETDNIKTFVFKPTEKLSWIPGQHAMFFLKDKNNKNSMHIFSVTSTPQEEVIRFSTKISENPSDYKQSLLALKLNDTITMRGPIASFYLINKKPTVLIAAGIGITPYRSILNDVHHNPNKKPDYLKLLYLDKNQTYIYKTELDQWHEHGDVAVDYVSEKEAFFLEIIEFATLYKNDAVYFLAGPKALVASIAKRLKSHGVASKNIKKDSFIGY